MFATFAWQFLPEFMFPMVAALAPLCWFAPNNHKVNFLGAGSKGIGLLNITLDWSNITSTVITYPYSVQVVIFAGFVITVSFFPLSFSFLPPAVPIALSRGGLSLLRGSPSPLPRGRGGGGRGDEL